MVTGKRLASRLDEQPTIVINGDKALTTATNVTLLGLEIDSRLSFNNHVDKIYKKTLSAYSTAEQNNGLFTSKSAKAVLQCCNQSSNK